MAEKYRKLTELVGRLKEAAQANLQAAILYGSAARGDHREGHSDLNVLCVMASLDVGELKRVAPVVKWWTAKEKEPAPLFFTEKELQHSADVFAIELFDMQRERLSLVQLERVLVTGDRRIAGERATGLRALYAFLEPGALELDPPAGGSAPPRAVQGD